MDAKDYAILRELDSNFRQSFSSIAKKVNLSKNSIALRFDKLKQYMLHNVTGIDNEALKYSLVKVYYSLSSYNEKTEKEIINEVKKHPTILWAARFYGGYDLCIGLSINNLSDLITHVSKFNKKFSNIINHKDIQVLYKQFYFRNNFIHKKPIYNIQKVVKKDKKISLSKVEKEILHTIRYNPRMGIVEIAKKTKLTPKTVSTKIKKLENNGVITGYYMTLDSNKFGFNTFKLLLQVQNIDKHEDFEIYLSSINNIRYIAKLLGSWDYEIDCVYSNITELQKQIDLMKQKFPKIIKDISILSLGYRIVTNKENFLI